MIGSILNSRYEVLEMIGEGGMSFVYKAKDLTLQRMVAVKVLKNEFNNDKIFVEKFKAEALAAGGLHDNNIVSIYDAGTHGFYNYIVMEYIHGKTLKDIIIERGPLETKEVVEIAMEITKALDCAHRNNIVHRDIKPHNIIMTSYGTPKITDFGIAKASSSATIAHTSRVMGSVHYISPEQAKGEIVDARSDLYSLGIVIYEMVTGKMPFDSETAITIAIKHIQDEVVAPNMINNMVPYALNRLIMRLLEKDPANRYQNAKELLTDLNKLKDGTMIFPIGSNQNEREYTKVLQPMAGVNRGVNKVYTENIYDEEEVEEERAISRSSDNDTSNKKNSNKNSISNKKKGIMIGSITGLVVLILIAAIVIGTQFAKSNEKVVEEVIIPEIANIQQTDGINKLEALGIKYQITTVNSDDAAAGIIIYTNPKSGTTVKKDRVIEIGVSKGPGDGTVPSIINQGKDAAIKNINDNKFQLGKIDEKYSESVEKGKVIDQNPSPNSKVAKGTPINIVISLGPEYSNYDLKGKTFEEAKALLNGYASLNPTYQESNKEEDKKNDGKIIDQDKTRVKQGETITVKVIKYAELTKEIDKYIGLTLDEAKEKLKSFQTEIELVVEILYPSEKDKNKEDTSFTVKAQSLAEGYKAKKGEKIRLTVELIEKPTTIIDDKDKDTNNQTPIENKKTN